MTEKPKRILLITGAIAGLALGGGAIAGAGVGGGDDDRADTPIRGAALDRASRVALDYAGGGRITATEVGDEEGHYEVEVTRADGSQLDVHLDRGFHVLGAAADGDGPNDD